MMAAESDNWGALSPVGTFLALSHLRPQDLSPGQHALHQWPHAQFIGDGQDA